VPRISIVIAHHNDQRLEDTLLSVLENRPRDCEIIVAHDGSYADPYHLADEVLFVQTNDGASRVGKLNEALYAACAPVVHILAEGVQVTDGWCEGPVETIQQQLACAVAPLLQTTDGRTTTYAGLDGELLAKRRLQVVKNHRAPSTCAGPLLAAGFYSRRLLLGLGGIFEAVDSQVADVDLALCMQQLNLSCEVDASSVVVARQSVALLRSDAAIAQDLASLLAAHHQVSSGVVAGIKGASHHLLTNLLDPSQWAPAIAWGIGLASNRLESSVAARIASWKQAQASQNASATIGLNVFGSILNSASPTSTSRSSSTATRKAA
jgi:hypothetical protein